MVTNMSDTSRLPLLNQIYFRHIRRISLGKRSRARQGSSRASRQRCSTRRGPVADLGGGQGALAGGGNGFGPVLKGGPAGGGIFWPVGQKFWARGK